MLYIFSPEKKFTTWRQLWIALAEIEKELGLDITDEQIQELKDNATNIDYDVAAAYEKKFRHDVMAHVHTYGDVAPSAKAIIHLGATSAFVGDNTDLIQIRDGFQHIKGQLINVIDGLAKFARQYKDLPTLGFTHFQPAQLTTVGKRATLWLQSVLLDLEELEFRIDTLRFRGVKGTTGTAASFKELFDGDYQKVKTLDKKLSERFGFKNVFAVSGQTYDRKIDAQALELLSNIAQSAANKRLAVPQAFLAIDAILIIWNNILDGLVVYPKIIEKHIAEELPFMATEYIIMEGVKNGGDRQELHEIIRTHSMEAAKQVKMEGKSNDLIERIIADDNVKIDKEKLVELLDPKNFTGFASEQTEEFLNDLVDPIIEENKTLLGAHTDLKV